MNDTNDTNDARGGSGINARPLNEGLAGTGPGIPDDARAPGEEIPEPPSEEEVERIARKLGAPTPPPE